MSRKVIVVVSDWNVHELLLILSCYLFMIALLETNLNQLEPKKNMYLKQCKTLTVLWYYYIHIFIFRYAQLIQ